MQKSGRRRGGENREIVVESIQTTWKSYYQNIADVLNKGKELVVKPKEIRKVMQVYDAGDAVCRDRRNRTNLVGATSVPRFFMRTNWTHDVVRFFLFM